MALELNQIKEALKSPKNKKAINKAASFEQRLRFHTETNISIHDASSQASLFLDWVKGLIPLDKYNVFLQLFSFPLPTISTVEDIYRELERVFYSRNSSSSYQFSNSEAMKDWEAYKKNKLKEPDIWKDKGFLKMKTAVNSIVVVDMPQQQLTDKPEPYFYWLDITEVVDFDSSDGVSLEWVIFKQPNSTIAVFDDKSMRTFKVNDSFEILSELTNEEHSLGYCAARFFWSSHLTEKHKLIKKNPITKELSNLDWLLFFEISKRHLDLYAPYPIYSAYEAECEFSNDISGDYCDGGFLRNDSGAYIITNGGLLEKCPACSEKRLSGPGSFIEIPSPVEGAPDLKNPVQITTIDEKSLKYNVDECIRLNNKIIVSCVGSGGTVSEKEAINETQVAANFENKTSVLNALKTNFENIQKFIDDTICKLRYGDDFISSSISWGTEFYVFTVDNLYKRYELAKKNGASEAELDALSIQIIETEYKNNPVQLQRMLTLRQIEPFRHFTQQEIILLLEKQLVKSEDVKLKLNFASLVDKFERENINIVEFGSKLDYDTKINTITKKLKEYVTD